MNKGYSNAPMAPEMVRHAAGSGNWRRFFEAGLTLDAVRQAAGQWHEAAGRRSHLWLCWSVDPAWCTIQQRLVRMAGWTPVVGWDPRTEPPKAEPGAILIDFNAHLKLPTLWPHFPIELAHLWIRDQLAFWHADLLLRPWKMRNLSETFAGLPSGAMAAVLPRRGLLGSLRARWRRELRYWELIGCTSRQAAQRNWERGCGWWSGWPWHPSNDTIAQIEQRTRYYWDSGAGIWYWHKHCGGQVHLIPEAFVSEGHFTGIGKPDYQRASPKDFTRELGKELSLNYDLADACRRLEIA